MKLNAVQLGERLRAARERRGLSQQTIGDALGLKRTAVTNMESGKRAVSTLELTRLAQMYDQPVTFFLMDRTDEEDLATVLFRIVPEFAEDSLLRQAVERTLDLCQEGVGLRRLLRYEQEDTLPNYSLRMHTAGEAVSQGVWVAQVERQRLGLGNAPVADIAKLIAEQGVWVAAAELPEWLSGLYLHHASIGLAILVNGAHPFTRRRFSYAHEYAHALLDRSLTVQPTRKENSSELVEKRANAFAAAFLMPADGVTDMLHRLHKGHPSRSTQTVFDAATGGVMEAEIRPRPGTQAITFQDIAAIARHFQVSYEAAVWRLRSLGHIGASECSALIEQKDHGRRYMRLLGASEEPTESLSHESGTPSKPPADEQLRHHLARLAIEAYRQEEISRGRLRELARKLGVASEELLDLAEATRAE
ncbi:helix-turn-helix domain-containing protein [Gloeobacter violaceus]|nr:XRE family transcriptional regulator [Gloeobacter violaceus]